MKRALYTIAQELLEGPYMVVPESRKNEIFAYMHVLRIIRPLGTQELKPFSVSIFTDQTVNKHNNFANPIVRTVIWDMHKDRPVVRKKNGTVVKSKGKSWPSVKILYHLLNKSEEKKVHDLILKLDTVLAKIKFKKAGLIHGEKLEEVTKKRIYKNVESQKQFYPIRIYRHYDCYQLEYWKPYYPRTEVELENATKGLYTYIIKLCEKKSEGEKFREVYKHNLERIGRKEGTWSYMV